MAQAHWTEQMFLEHSNLFLEVHEVAIDKAEAQAREVMAILRRGKVNPPARILDAPCGIGRHDVHLAKAGYGVTGLDYAPAFLDRGRRLAAELGSDPEFVHGDMRRVRQVLHGREGTFSAILNLWTSIGYWGEETDLDMLRQFHALAAPGGLLVLETINHDFLVKNLLRHGKEEWGDLVLVEERAFDIRDSWISSTWRFYRRHERDLRHEATVPVRHRVYAPHELWKAVGLAGWTPLGLFGSLGMEALVPDRSRLVLVARKEA